MSFLTKMLFAVKTHVHVQCTKISDFFDVICYFSNFLLDQGVQMWISDNIHTMMYI
jgi:hypothetical protein